MKISTPVSQSREIHRHKDRPKGRQMHIGKQPTKKTHRIKCAQRELNAIYLKSLALGPTNESYNSNVGIICTPSLRNSR